MSASNKKKSAKAAAFATMPAATPQNTELIEKIKVLEIKLSDCRRQLSNYEGESNRPDLPATKVSFRIDYYRNGDKTDLKGVIEHLSTREKRPFTGLGDANIGAFIRNHIPETVALENMPAARPEASVVENISLVGSEESTNASLVKRGLNSVQQQDAEAFAFFSHLFQPEQTAAETSPRESRLLRRFKSQGILSSTTPVESRQAATPAEAPRESRLLRKLRTRLI